MSSSIRTTENPGANSIAADALTISCTKCTGVRTVTTWSKLTEEFLRMQCGEFTSRDLAAYFQARSSYIYPDDIILATANRMLRKQ